MYIHPFHSVWLFYIYVYLSVLLHSITAFSFLPMFIPICPPIFIWPSSCIPTASYAVIRSQFLTNKKKISSHPSTQHPSLATPPTWATPFLEASYHLHPTSFTLPIHPFPTPPLRSLGGPLTAQESTLIRTRVSNTNNPRPIRTASRQTDYASHFITRFRPTPSPTRV